MQTSEGLMEILKDNEIRGYSHYTKSKLIDLLIKFILHGHYHMFGNLNFL